MTQVVYGRDVPGMVCDAELCRCTCSLCAPDKWLPEAAGLHPSGLHVVGEYPSLRQPPHFSPVRVLLDTCVVQQLLWTRVHAPDLADEGGWERVVHRFGEKLGTELAALSGLRLGVEDAISHDEGCVFLASRTAWDELSRAPRHRRIDLLEEWRMWRIAPEHTGNGLLEDPASDERLSFRCTPEELAWPMPDQMVLPLLRQNEGRLGPFYHAGDVALIAEAMSLGMSAILTTDLRSFWNHREWLFEKGVEVWRPSDLCWAMWNDALMYNGQFGPFPRWPVGPLSSAQECSCA